MKLRLPVRLLAAVVAAASHVAFLTVASASGAWAVENASADLTFTDSADAPAIVADGESLAELPSAQSAEEAVVTLSDAEAEKVTAADAALPEEIAAAGDSVVVTAPMTAEDVAEVSAAPEVKTVGGANTTENVTGAKLLAEEAALVAEYNAIMPGAEGTETPAVSYPANNAAATQTAAADLTVPETAVASDNTTTLNLSAASAAPQTQTAALTTETVSGSTGAASVPSTASAAAPVFMTTGSEPSSAGRSAPVFLVTGAAGADVSAPAVFPTTGDPASVSYEEESITGTGTFTLTPERATWYKHNGDGGNQQTSTYNINGGSYDIKLSTQQKENQNLGSITAKSLVLSSVDGNSRFKMVGGTSLNLTDGLSLAGAQLWVESDWVYNGDISLKNSNFAGDAGTQLEKAAMRINANLTLGGDVTLAGDTKITWQAAGKTVNMTGSLSGSGDLLLSSYGGNSGTLRLSGSITGYNGTIRTTETPIAFNMGPVSIAAASNVAVSGSGSFAITGTVKNAGTLTLNKDFTLAGLDLDDASRWTAKITGTEENGYGKAVTRYIIQNTGTLGGTYTLPTVEGYDLRPAADGITFTSATADTTYTVFVDETFTGFCGNTKMSTAQIISIESGAVATLSQKQSGGGGTLRQTVIVRSGGTLKTTAGDTMGWTGANSVRVLTVEDGGKVSIEGSSANETFGGTLNLNGGRLTGAAGSMFDFLSGASLSVASGDHATIDTITLRLRRDDTTFTVGSGASLDISSNINHEGGNGDGELVKAGAGAMTLSGNVAVNSLSSYGGGKVVVDGATVVITDKLQVSESGGNGAFTLQSGSLKAKYVDLWRQAATDFVGGSVEFTQANAIQFSHSSDANKSTTNFGRTAGGVLSDENQLILKATESSWAITPDRDGVVNIGNVTIAAENTQRITFNSVNLYGLIRNNANLTLGGTISLYGQSQTVYMMPEAGKNGFANEIQYWNLVENGENADTQLAESTVLKSGTETLSTRTQDGYLQAFKETQPSTVYYVGINNTTYNNDFATASSGATKYVVGDAVNFNSAGTNLAGKALVLNAGSSLSSETGGDFTKIQIQSVELQGNAAIHADKANIALLGSAYADTTMTLNGYTLTVDGANRLGLFNTNVSAGTILLSGGTAQVGYSSKTASLRADDTVLEMSDANNRTSKLVLGNSSTATLEGLKGTGSVEREVGTPTLVLAPTLGTEEYRFTGNLGTYGLNLTMIQGSTGTQTFEMASSATLGTVSVEGGTLNITSTSTAASTPTVAVSSLLVETGATFGLGTGLSASGDVRIVSGGTLALGGTELLSTSGALTLQDGSTLDLTGLTLQPGSGEYILATGSSVSLGNAKGFTLGSGYDKDDYELSVVDGANGKNLVLTFITDSRDLIWDNNSTDNSWTTSANWHTEDSTEDHLAFAKGDNIRFTATPANPAPRLGTDVLAGTMTIDSGVAVTVDTNGHSLSVEKIQSEGGKLIKNGAGTATFGAGEQLTLAQLTTSAGKTVFEGRVAVSGKDSSTYWVNFNADTELKGGFSFSGSSSNSYAFLVGNSATVTLWDSTDVSAYNVGLKSGTKLVLEEGAALTANIVLNSSSNNGSGNGKVEMKSGSRLTLKGINLYVTGFTSDGGTLALENNGSFVNLYAATFNNDTPETFSLGNVVLSGNATIQAVNHGGTVKLDSISYAGTGTGTLTLKTASTSTARNTFSIGGGQGESGFAGNINLVRYSNGNKRVLLGEFNDENSAARAVVTVSLENYGSGETNAVGIGINNSLVKMKGLQDGTDISSATSYVLFSGGAADLPTTCDDAGSYFNGVTTGSSRVLEFVGDDSSASYTTAIRVLGGVDVTMSSAGTQSFTGDLHLMNGAVSATAGTLVLANSNSTAGSLASVVVSGGELDLSNMNVSGAVTLSSGLLDMAGAGAVTTGDFTMTSGTLKLAGENLLTSTGSITLSSGTLDLSRLTMDDATQQYTLATGSSITLDNSVSFTLADGYNKDDYTLTSDGTHLLLTFQEKTQELVWIGGEHVWDKDSHHKSWYGENPSTPVSYTQDADVRFAASDTPSVALLQENVEAGLMTVDSGADVTIRNGDDAVPHTLTVADLVVEGVLHTQAALNVTDSLTIRNAEGALPAKVKMEAFENFVLSTPIMGNGMLEKSGQGTVTIKNKNTAFTGSLIVEEGTVVLGTTDAMRSADVMVYTDAALALKEPGTKVSTLWLEDGAILSFNTGATLVADGADMMFGKGAILSANSIINLFDYDIDSEIPESITLVTATNGIALGDEDGSVLLTMPTGYHGSLALSEDGSTLSLVNITHVDPYYWKGGNGMWDTAETNKSWYVGAEGTEPVAFVQDKDVVFDDRAAVSAVTVNGTMDVTTMTVEAGTDVTLIGGKLAANKIILNGNLTTQGDVTANLVDLHGENSRWNIATAGTDRTFSGVISHHGTLVKSGDGTLTLTADNSAFSGVTQLQEGKIIAANEAGYALGGAPRVEMGDGAELDGKLAVVHGHTHASVEVAKGFATLSAALTLHEESQITLGGAGTLNATGAISGSGAVLKDGAGILMLSGDNKYSGGTTISSGTVEVLSANALGTGNVQVNAGAYLKLDSQTLRNEETAVSVGGNLKVLSAGTLAVGSNSNLAVDGTLTFGTGTVFDLSGVTLDDSGKAVLGTVTGGIVSLEGNSGYQDGRLNYVALENLNNSTGAAAGVKTAKLRYDSGTKELYVVMEGTDGYYWTGKNVGDDPVEYEYSGNWKDAEWAKVNGQGTGSDTHKSYTSAFFMNKATATVSINDDRYVNQLIIGAGDYTFDGKGTLHLSDNEHAYLKDTGIIVREGASATIHAGITGASEMALDVEEKATLIMDNVGDATFKDVTVAGTLRLETISTSLIRTVISDTGKIFLTSPEVKEMATSLSAQQIINRGILQVSVGNFVYMAGVGASNPNPESQRGIINLGTTVFDTTNAQYLLVDDDGNWSYHSGVFVAANITGGGDIVTSGSGKVKFADSWYLYGDVGYLSVVDADDITITAKETEFDAHVTSTGTLKLTAEAFAEDDDKRSLTSFMASASLNKVEMGADTTLHFQGGRESLGEAHDTSGIYTMDSVTTTGTDQRIEVMSSAKVNVAHAVKAQDGALIVGDKANQQDDATFHSGDNVSLNGLEVNSQAVVDFAGAANTVTTFDMNGGTFTAAGTNTVTTLNQAGGSIALNLEGTGANTIGTVNMTGGTLTAKGDTSIVMLNQSGTGSVVTLEQGGTLGVKGAADAGTVSGGTLTLGNNAVLRQEAVVNVVANGSYTLASTSGSINASDLTLERTSGGYKEVFSSTSLEDGSTEAESGFMTSGSELVKLFDMGSDATLTSNGMTVSHALASGQMTLIGTDNKDDFSEAMAGDNKDVDDYVGWAYLHTAETSYVTYYVRDNYVTGELDGRVSVHADDKGQLTLSDIQSAADASSQTQKLGGIVFDRTKYNKDVSGYHGTLTVDENASADMFAVTSGTNAMIHVTADAVVKADSSYHGVQGSLALQGLGVYELENRADLGANVSLRDNNATVDDNEWNGTVRVTGTAENLSMKGLSVGAGADASTIEFKNWSGTFMEDGNAYTSSAHVVLTGVGTKADPAAITITGGDALTYTWDNSVSSNGQTAAVVHESGEDFTLNVTGDASAWTGRYDQNAGTSDKLTFTGGTAVHVDSVVSKGSLSTTYGGAVKTVDGQAVVYNGSSLDLHYTGTGMAVSGDIYSETGSKLTLTVGDGTAAADATFSGQFLNTGEASMYVKDNSAATLATNAALLRVVGDAGSMVTVNEDETLTLTSTEAETYSEFHGLTNDGTIAMKADGGDIHLVVDDGAEEGTTFDMGSLELDGGDGIAHVGADTTNGKATVNISDLKSSESGDQKLVLQNMYGTGEVDYNLDLTDEEGGAQFHGKIRFGTEDSSVTDGTTRVVLGSENVAADAVLESVGNGTAADVVVDTDKAKVKGITSEGQAGVGGKVYGTAGEGEENKQLVITGNDTYSYNGALGENLDVAYTGSGKQTFEGGVDGFNGAVTVGDAELKAGVMEILQVAQMDITDLTIGQNNELVLKDDSGNGTAHVSSGVVALGTGVDTASKLKGSLTLAADATLDVAAAGGVGGINLSGSDDVLTFNGKIKLAEDSLTAIKSLDAWTYGQYDLAFGVETLNLFGREETSSAIEYGQVDAAMYIAGLESGRYYLVYSGADAGGNGGQVGTLSVVVPEPTTSTLSLLALAALCARRRRKA